MHDPNNEQLISGLDDVKSRISSSSGARRSPSKIIFIIVCGLVYFDLLLMLVAKCFLCHFWYHLTKYSEANLMTWVIVGSVLHEFCFCYQSWFYFEILFISLLCYFWKNIFNCIIISDCMIFGYSVSFIHIKLQALFKILLLKYFHLYFCSENSKAWHWFIIVVNPFEGANAEAKLMADPTTREFMKDPGFLKILSDIKSNPELLKMWVAAMIKMSICHLEKTQCTFIGS